MLTLSGRVQVITMLAQSSEFGQMQARPALSAVRPADKCSSQPAFPQPLSCDIDS